MKTTSLFISHILPDFLWPIKVYLFKKNFFSHGINIKIGKNSYFIHIENISLGDDVFIGQEFYCSTLKRLKIGNRVMFGPKCSIIGGDHDFSNTNYNMRYTNEQGDNREIIIEDDVWIGLGTLRLKKAQICEGSIIGARSIVNSKVEPYCVYTGSPEKKVKPRFETYNDLILYLEMMKTDFHFTSKYTLKELKGIYEK